MTLDFEELRVGVEIPPLVKGAITRQHLVEWCAAENDYYPLHYDEREATKFGLPGTPIQGTFRYALLGQKIGRWLGGHGRLAELSVSYVGMNYEGETLTASGRIARLVEADGERRVFIDLALGGPGGGTSTTGAARIEGHDRRG